MGMRIAEAGLRTGFSNDEVSFSLVRFYIGLR